MLWIEMRTEVLENDVLFEEFIDKVAGYTIEALVGAAQIVPGEDGVYRAAISVGYGEGDAKGTYGVMFDASYVQGDEDRGPVKASERYGVTFWNFKTSAKAVEFADKFGAALARDEKEYSVKVINNPDADTSFTRH